MDTTTATHTVTLTQVGNRTIARCSCGEQPGMAKTEAAAKHMLTRNHRGTATLAARS